MLNTKTLSGRYILIALLLVIILIAIGWTGHRVVDSAVQGQFGELGERERARQVIDACVASSRHLEIALQRYIILPEEDASQRLVELITSSEQLGAKLLETPWVSETVERKANALAYLADLGELHSRIRRVVAVRKDHRQWIPAMAVMEERLLPANETFTAAMALAINEGAEEEKISEQHRRVFRELLRIHDGWVAMISEFRLLVSNRFGVFASDVHQAMSVRAQNIALNREIVDAGLVRLAIWQADGMLGLQTAVSLNQMQAAYKDWWQYYQQVVENLQSPKWRRDIPLLLYAVDPQLAAIRKQLSTLEHALHQSSADEIGLLTRLIELLQWFVWTLVLASAVVIGAGYWVFQRVVLAPIKRVSQALKAEASGESGITMPDFALQETRDLGEAFNEMHEQVNDRQQRLKMVLDNAAEAIITIDQKGLVQSFNRAAELMFGYHESEMKGQNVSRLMPHGHREKHDGYLSAYLETGRGNIVGHEREVPAQRRDGSQFPISLKVSETLIRGERVFIGLLEDISERKAMLQALSYRAERDPLTGLVNRQLFQDRLEHALEQSARRSGLVALLFIDIDDFKSINDEFGHQAGDDLLKIIAKRLHGMLRSGDTLARIGGDEFTAILEGLASEEHGLRVAANIVTAFAEPVVLNGRERMVTGSVGIAFNTDDGMLPETLIANADMAMYAAKRAGKNRYRAYTADAA